MKKISFPILMSILLSFATSCSQTELDLSPVSSITDGNFWKSAEQWESFVVGLHSRMRTHTYNLFQLGGLRADEFGESSFGGESTNNRERLWLNTLNISNPGVTNFADFYSNINQINLLIQKTEETTLLPEASKTYYLGQGYGMRAFYYFHLLRSWGDVIIHQTATTTFDLSSLAKAASPAAEVMALIKADLTKSEAAFGTNYTVKLNKALWSKSATLMLKAEVYLWSARRMAGGATDAGVAKAALTSIQQNVPAFGLLPSFKDVFAYANKGNKEVIFALRNELNEYNFMGGEFVAFLPQINYIGNYYDSLSKAKIDVQKDLVGGTGGFQAPIKKSTYRRFSNEDSRKYASIQGAFTLTGGQYVLAGCFISKYQGIINAGSRVMVDDYPVYRYADLLLMLAEAKTLMGEDPATEINLVRQRAFGANYKLAVHGYPNQVGDNNLPEMILKERFFEFIGEGKRWYDLLRFGKDYVFKYTTVTEEYKLLWPIDQGTLTNNKALKQTPGYL
jgi:starch-binding outer membrane protein, SusD/RagB family